MTILLADGVSFWDENPNRWAKSNAALLRVTRIIQ